MSIGVDWRASVGLVGTVLKYLLLPLILPVLVALYLGESVFPLLMAVVATAVIGFTLEWIGGDRDLGGREAFLMVALTWMGIALIGAIPFVASGNGSVAHPVNALFESMSGITTTGATVITDFDAHSKSVMLWRQLLQWLGGLGILVLATAVLSQLGVGGAQLMETETQTRTVNKLTPTIEETAKLMVKLYTGLTVLVVAALYSLHLLGLAPNMTLYNAVAHSFTSISTSGYSPEPRSIEAFSSAVQWALIPVMFVGATSFILIYYVLRGDFNRLKQSSEFKFYTGVLSFLSLTVFIVLALEFGEWGLEGIRHSIFNVTSILTTTGYASTDFNAWPSAAKHILFICMFIGGMAGSTTCSIKAFRWLVVAKAFRRDLYRNVHPDAIRPVRIGGKVIDDETVSDVYSFVLLSIIFFLISAIIISVDASRTNLGIDEFEALGAAAATFFNIGPAFGIAGPMESYDSFSYLTKSLMILLMWIGRIEIIPVLVILTPTFWRR